MKDNDELLTLEEMATLLKIDPQTARKRCEWGGPLSGKAFKDGRQWRIWRSDLMEYLDRQRGQSR